MNVEQLLSKNSPERQSDPSGGDLVLFEQIKSIQSLPDEVVEQFLKCKGTLRHKKNILHDAR